MAYVTVSGLTTGLYVPITVIGTASNIAILVTQPGTNPYSIASTSGYTTTLTGWFAQNGTVIDLRATSSTEYAQTTYVTLEVGGTSSTWYLTTENAPNNAPIQHQFLTIFRINLLTQLFIVTFSKLLG